MSKRGVQVVPFEEEYQSQTLDLFRRWNPDHPELADPDLFDWQRCHRFLAIMNNRVVGHVAQIVHPFKSGGQGELSLGWGATLVLDQSNPLIQTFAGTALLDRVTKESSVPFAAVGVVPEIEPTHRKRGYNVRRDLVSMYSRFLRPHPVLRYYEKSNWLTPIVHLANLARPRHQASNPSLRIESVKQFDPKWDSVWDRLLSRENSLYGVRSAEFLNYKLAQPGKTYHVGIARDSSDQLIGCIVFRRAEHRVKELTLLKVVELIGTTNARRSLMSYAMTTDVARDVDAIVCIAPMTDRKTMANAGLWVKKAYPVVLPPDLDGPMYLSFFDSDLDNLW